MTIEAVGEAFTRQFQHFDGYKSPARQADLERVFRAGAHWQAEQDHLGESEIAKVAAQRAVRIAELEALVDSLDRQIEARSGKTTAERIWCERAKQAEAKLDLIRETLSESPACDKYDEGDAITCGWKWDMQAVRAILDGDGDDE